MEERVSFYSGAGLKLAAILEKPEADNKARPAVVICNGPGGGKDGLAERVSHWLVAADYIVLRFDYRGIGESDGPKSRLIPLEQAEDIGNAVTFLQQQKGVDPQRIGLWGVATGGAAATWAAGTDRRVKCLVCANGMSDLGAWLRDNRRYWEWVELLKLLEEDRVKRVLTGVPGMLETPLIPPNPNTQRYRDQFFKDKPMALLTLESVEAMVNFRPIEVVPRIAPRAAMWICARQETLIPTEQIVAAYEKAGEPKRLYFIEGVEHHQLYTPGPFEEMMKVSVEWFNQQL